MLCHVKQKRLTFRTIVILLQGQGIQDFEQFVPEDADITVLCSSFNQVMNSQNMQTSLKPRFWKSESSEEKNTFPWLSSGQRENWLK